METETREEIYGCDKDRHAGDGLDREMMQRARAHGNGGKVIIKTLLYELLGVNLFIHSNQERKRPKKEVHGCGNLRAGMRAVGVAEKGY